jgi:hypothetical protein
MGVATIAVFTIGDHVDHPSCAWCRSGSACSLQCGQSSCRRARAHGWRKRSHFVRGSRRGNGARNKLEPAVSPLDNPAERTPHHTPAPRARHHDAAHTGSVRFPFSTNLHEIYTPLSQLIISRANASASDGTRPRNDIIISDPRQCTVCGPDKSALDLISAPSITLYSLGALGSVAVSTI